MTKFLFNLILLAFMSHNAWGMEKSNNEGAKSVIETIKTKAFKDVLSKEKTIGLLIGVRSDEFYTKEGEIADRFKNFVGSQDSKNILWIPLDPMGPLNNRKPQYPSLQGKIDEVDFIKGIAGMFGGKVSRIIFDQHVVNAITFSVDVLKALKKLFTKSGEVSFEYELAHSSMVQGIWDRQHVDGLLNEDKMQKDFQKQISDKFSEVFDAQISDATKNNVLLWPQEPSYYLVQSDDPKDVEKFFEIYETIKKSKLTFDIYRQHYNILQNIFTETEGWKIELVEKAWYPFETSSGGRKMDFMVRVSRKAPKESVVENLSLTVPDNLFSKDTLDEKKFKDWVLKNKLDPKKDYVFLNSKSEPYSFAMQNVMKSLLRK